MDVSNYKSSLSNREANLLATLERDGRSVVALDELKQRFGKPRAYELVRSLTKKRVFRRIDRGVYLVQPFRSLGRAWTVSAPVAVTHVLAREPHYLGGIWAWWFHRLTPQIHGSRVDAFVTRWRPVRELGNARVHFHRLPASDLSVGVELTRMEDVDVRVSDRERTLLDALDHPSLFGSLSDAIERVVGALEHADPKRIVSHAAHVSHPSTCQRLAVLLERAGVSSRALGPLVARTGETKSLLSLWPDRRREGRVHDKWRVVENDDAPFA